MVMKGDGLKPSGKPLDSPPYPTIMHAQPFYPDSVGGLAAFALSTTSAAIVSWHGTGVCRQHRQRAARSLPQHMGRHTHSLALVADGRHLLSDAYTSTGVL